MKIFEFYFNPKKQTHTKYESFCYEPENAAEKRLGHLCATGELTNVLPTNVKLLQNLATTIRNTYYSPAHSDPASAIQNAMQGANTHLASLSKKEDVSWLGNLHLAIISIAGNLIHLSKVGGVKVLLARNDQMIDIGADLENPNLTPYPTHIFPNLIEGKLLTQDKIFILTKELFQFFDAIGLLGAFMHLPPGKEQKKIKELLRPHEKQLKEYSGVFVLLVLDKISSTETRWEFPHISFAVPSIPKFPIRPPMIKALKIKPSALSGGIKNKLPVNIHFPSFKILSFLRPTFSTKHQEFRKKTFIVLAFLLVLILGVSFAKIQSKKANDAAEESFLAMQQKIWQAQSLLIAQKESDANALFQESLAELQKLENSSIKDRIEKAKQEVEKELISINKIENVSDIAPLFSIENPDFSPSVLLVLPDSLYILAPTQQKMYIWDIQKAESHLTDLQWSFDAVAAYNPFLIFYDKNKNSVIAGDGEVINLHPPYPAFQPNAFISFLSGLYFLDASNGQIVKYPFLEGQNELTPRIWTASPDKKIKTGVSLAIDGSVWILSQDGQILRYWGGELQETLQPKLWPKLSKPVKIFTKAALPYLYILDPPEKRIVILDKKGNVIRQHTSEKFNKLKDFSVSPDGTTIYLLNDRELYSIPVSL